eukprot:5972779-Alexandrium_andersonii.AAC.1
MSASLVGSEMCIRDRPFPHGASRPEPQPVHRRNPSCTDLTNMLIELATVSYTHLTLPTICSV